jgi:alpha-beta hydrolase superfamily lysophospholipase
MVGKESPNHPIFLLAHSMGGLIGSMAMARYVSSMTMAKQLVLLIDQRSVFDTVFSSTTFAAITNEAVSDDRNRKLSTFALRPSSIILLSLTLLLMYRLPTLISRAVLCAPMIRNKCGVKYFDFKFAPPQPLVYWVTVAACYAGTFVVAAVLG